MVFLCAGAAVFSGNPRADEAAAPEPAAETARIPPPETPPEWQPLFKGVDYAEVVREAPEPLSVHAVRIDLADPDIRFLVTPQNGGKDKETDALKTSSFLVHHGCQVAVNASPFAPVANQEGEPQDILGLSVSEGDQYSNQHPKFGSLIITKDNKVSMSEPPLDASTAHNAVGGFMMLLEDGENAGTGGERHPRTAAGVSKDGTRLYLVVIDGRQPDRSVGTSTAETAEWMRYLGAFTALNLDGGGSAALAVADGEGGAKLLNRPIHNRLPGMERPVANHLGVFAKPLAEGAPAP